MLNSLPKLISTIMLASFLGLPQAQAQGPGGPGMGMGPDDDGPPMRMLERLNLSDDQRSQIQTLRETNQSEMKAGREAIRAAHAELRTLMQGEASESDLRTAHAKVQDLMQKQGNERFEQMLKIRAILTPEQRKELGAFRGDRGRGRKDGRGQSRGRGPGSF